MYCLKQIIICMYLSQIHICMYHKQVHSLCLSLKNTFNKYICAFSKYIYLCAFNKYTYICAFNKYTSLSAFNKYMSLCAFNRLDDLAVGAPFHSNEQQRIADVGKVYIYYQTSLQGRQVYFRLIFIINKYI